MTVDSSNAKSSFFGYRIADLESILSGLTNSYPNLLDKIQAQCTINPDQKPEFDFKGDVGQVKAKAGWTCGLYAVKDSTLLLQFYVLNEYTLNFNQTNTQLNVQITDVVKKSSNWKKVLFDIVNEPLAELYLTDIVSQFNGQYTLGTKFAQPARTFPKVTILDGAVQVFDAGDQEITV